MERLANHSERHKPRDKKKKLNTGPCLTLKKKLNRKLRRRERSKTSTGVHDSLSRTNSKSLTTWDIPRGCKRKHEKKETETGLSCRRAAWGQKHWKKSQRLNTQHVQKKTQAPGPQKHQGTSGPLPVTNLSARVQNQKNRSLGKTSMWVAKVEKKGVQT